MALRRGVVRLTNESVRQLFLLEQKFEAHPSTPPRFTKPHLTSAYEYRSYGSSNEGRSRVQRLDACPVRMDYRSCGCDGFREDHACAACDNSHVHEKLRCRRRSRNWQWKDTCVSLETLEEVCV
jgi:hypothetical protein